MVTCIQGHLSGSYDSDLLAKLSPMLEVTFPHQKRAIKTQTAMLWNVTFGRSGSLKYPESLKYKFAIIVVTIVRIIQFIF